jgi:cysteine desulfurase
MVKTPVYMDNHATTRVDPRVIEAMLPYFGELYGNPGSMTHYFGWSAKTRLGEARATIAEILGARTKEIIFTSGATESNNLALCGAVEKLARRGKHIISVTTEHPSVLDPLMKLQRHGFEITLLPVIQAPDPSAGLVTAEQVAEALRDDTVLVSVMLANNEIGAVQPIRAIADVCHKRGVLLHCDATQAIGKMPLDVEQLGVDLMSFTAHKIYGPKGVGALYVRGRKPRVRLQSQIDGGGQEGGLRSGTLNMPGIAGLARAMELCAEEMPEEPERLRQLRDRLYEGLTSSLDGVTLNGPAIDDAAVRLPNNLNVSFARIDGEALLMSMKDLALSTGSACSSSDPQPSHVLRALGLGHELTSGSVRFGLGRFTTGEEIEFAIELVVKTVTRLRGMSSLM